ncbi:MAG: hypothetical protein H7099_06770 [Gemmatimonadaceae bacterium]|nr:hypothetical protein [Gemmatimonadaceae bacterium]
MFARSSLLFGLLAAVMLSACASRDATAPAPTPPANDGANLRVTRVQFTQGAQDEHGSIPMVAGQPMVANVLIARTRESATSVPVVLRLYRDGVLLRVDTTRSAGILGPSVNAASPSAQILVPGIVVRDSLWWQVEIDPANTTPDSTRGDNLFPATAPGVVTSVVLPPLDVRFVPIVLARHDGLSGNVSVLNLEQYASGVRAMLPTGALSATIGTPITSESSFGTAPDGAAPGFWLSVLQDVDIARVLSDTPQAVWYGVVPIPAGFSKITNGGYAFVPTGPTRTGSGTRTAVSLELSPMFGASYGRDLVAHELGHIFGRSHAPGCGALAPIDTAYPGALGAIGTPGHDVFAWASGLTIAALPHAASTGDVMSYCSPVWASPYTWSAVLRWRQAAASVVTRTARTRATLIAGTIAADGRVTLRPALDAEVRVPHATADGDVMVELRDAAGAVVGRQLVASAAIDHGGGIRHFLAVIPAAGAAAQVVATTRAGASAHVIARASSDIVTSRITPGGASELLSAAGQALLVRDDHSGEMLGIGWNGRITIHRSSGYVVTVSDGVHSRRATVIQR